MNTEKVYCYIGRFQISHTAHEETIKYALSKCDRLVLLVGSSDLARDPKNPFTFNERFKVLEGVCTRLAQEQWSTGRKVVFNILPVHDHIYNNNKWINEVQNQVLSVTDSKDIVLTGLKKDDSSYYLNFFPHWKSDLMKEVIKDGEKTINSAEIRNEYFRTGKVPNVNLPKESVEFLEKFLVSDFSTFELLREELDFITRYRAEMELKLPYKTIPFLTGDCLVSVAGNILVGVRRNFPGRGLFCVPGGFMSGITDKDQVDTAIRELYEETALKVPEKVLRGNIRKVEEFGDFNRSLRWRIITKCVYIQLPDQTLPKIKGSDDLAKCFWMPISEIVKNRDKFFEDHFFILENMLGI